MAEHLSDAERNDLQLIADFQFGAGAGESLFSGALVGSRSKTGRLRQVYPAAPDGPSDRFATPSERLATLGKDGRLTLGLAGGRRLAEALAAPAARVVVGEESVPFVRDGKNAFAKFVRSVDPSVRPRDEVAVVDEEGLLLAVGRAELAATAMESFEIGVAVKVRDGAGD